MRTIKVTPFHLLTQRPEKKKHSRNRKRRKRKLLP